MEFLQRLVRSLRTGRTVELPSDLESAAYVLLPMVIANQHKSLSELLTNTNFDINYQFGRSKRNLIHIAANCGSYECLLVLLKKGADVNRQDISGSTPLQLSVKNGQMNCLKKLLEHKADINITNTQSGLTAVHWSAVSGRTELLREMMPFVDNIDIEDSQGQTALHIACQNGHVSTVSYLLESGADCNRVNFQGQTPLHFASSHGQRDTVKILLSQGVMFTMDHSGRSPLQLAVEGGYCETCALLVETLPFLLDQLIQMSSNNAVDDNQVLHALEYDFRHGNQKFGLIMNKLCNITSHTGHKLLSVSSVLDIQAKSLRRCVNITCKFYASGKNASDENYEGNYFEPLDGMWSSLEGWLILLKDEISCDTTGSGSHVCQGSVESGNCGDNSSTDKTPVKLYTHPGVVPEDLRDIAKAIWPRLCALIYSYYLCQKCQHNDSTSPPRFVEFVERHIDVMKHLISGKPSMIFDHFNFLLECPDMMSKFLPVVKAQPFELRKQWFYDNLYSDDLNEHSGSLNSLINEETILQVQRESLFTSSCKQVLSKDPSHLKRNIAVKFDGEDGLGLGVVKEWFDVLSNEILNPDYALFTQSADGSTFQPNSNSSINPDHLNYFGFTGQIVALAMYHKQLLNVYFTRSFYKHILGIPLSYQDIASIDPQYADNLQWLLDNDISQLGLDLTFSVETDVFGVMQEVELKSDGMKITVTENNKAEYVQLVTELRMTCAIRPQICSFLSGFHRYIPKGLIQIFDEYELELMLSGLPEIDVDDWRRNTSYAGGYEDTSQVIEWFWEAINAFSQQERVMLLQFTTGSSRVPAGGFANLHGGGGSQVYTITYAEYKAGILPMASTCVNLLKLPEYTSLRELRDRIKMALDCARQGYGMA